MKRVIFLSLTFFFCISGFTQIKTNEKLVYAGRYKMSGIMTQLAQITVHTNLVNTTNKSYLHSSWELVTLSKWDSYFKIRDMYESYVDPKTYKPSLFKRNVLEGKYQKSEKYMYVQGKRTLIASSKRPGKPEKKKNLIIGANSLDIVSAIHKLRIVDFSKFKIGQTYPFSILFDEKEYPVSVKFMGKETLNAGNLGKKECYKLSISASSTDRLRGKDQNLIWITTDTNRVPVLIQFSIPVGIGQIALISAN
jgi:hypothetical protein